MKKITLFLLLLVLLGCQSSYDQYFDCVEERDKAIEECGEDAKCVSGAWESYKICLREGRLF
jgi:hypothetical protein